MPTTAPPLPIRISSRELEDEGVVAFFLMPGLGQQGDPVEILRVEKLFVNQHPWLFPQFQLLMHKLGQDILGRMGYVSDVKTVGAPVAPQATSTIILDPIEEKKRSH